MGCDIHMIVQTQTANKKWVIMEYPDINRNYELFALLADVRNPKDIEPICEPKGVPEDLIVIEDENGSIKTPFWHRDWHEICEFIYLGDHSFSWLTLAEIRAYDYKKANLLQECDPREKRVSGLVIPELSAYEQWTKSITVFDDEFLRILLAYGNHYDLEHVRLVFGFDS